MIALFILLFAVAVSVFINRVATQALVLTGLSRDVAEFQARSITTGTGFTTKEAESLLENSVRRKIAMLLMLIQNAGLITVISTFVLSFVNTSTTGIALRRATILVGGIGLLIFLAKNNWVTRQLKKLINRLLDRYSDLTIADYHSLLNLKQGFTISRFNVEENSWLSNRSLDDLNLHKEGVMVLCIERRDGSATCAPTGKDTLSPGDQLTLYGKEEGFQELRERKNDAAGQEAHEEAKEKHEQEQEQNK